MGVSSYKQTGKHDYVAIAAWAPDIRVTDAARFAAQLRDHPQPSRISPAAAMRCSPTSSAVRCVNPILFGYRRCPAQISSLS
jgi:hypothetical protein